MEINSLESEQKRTTAEIKELRELLGEAASAGQMIRWFASKVFPPDLEKWDTLYSRIQQKLDETQ